MFDRKIQIFIDIRNERTRQEVLKAQGKFPRTCADTFGGTNGERLAVVAEEFGEVARHVAEEYATIERAGLREELVQLAACCVGWCEAIDLEAEMVREKEKNSSVTLTINESEQYKERCIHGVLVKFFCSSCDAITKNETQAKALADMGAPVVPNPGLTGVSLTPDSLTFVNESPKGRWIDTEKLPSDKVITGLGRQHLINIITRIRDKGEV